MWVSWLNLLDSQLKPLKVILSLLVASHFPLPVLAISCASAFALPCLPPSLSSSSLSFYSSSSPLPLLRRSRPPLSTWNPRSSEDRTGQDRTQQGSCGFLAEAHLMLRTRSLPRPVASVGVCGANMGDPWWCMPPPPAQGCQANAPPSSSSHTWVESHFLLGALFLGGTSHQLSWPWLKAEDGRPVEEPRPGRGTKMCWGQWHGN